MLNMLPVSPVRVRFCPSPTGVPHVGLVRTALFNWAYARHTGGSFVFRIEDTDAARDSEESFTQLVAALKWLGLDWDEGVDVGGAHAPYRQSQRKDIYADVVKKLLAAGHIYESYSSAEEVTQRRISAGQDPKLGYDNFDRNLSAAKLSEYKAENRLPVLRLRMPDRDLVFDDLVRGKVVFKSGSVPDFVVVRANGAPLYTLVNPVDDALMEITHVLRGEDLLSSTPRQLALYYALQDIGVAKFVPQFGHLPYVMGLGNKKLSKRDPSSNLFLYKKRGFIAEGLLNYLALLGWGFSANQDVFSVAEFIAAFDIVKVNPNPARFDIKKAEAINGAHLRMLSAEDFLARLFEYFKFVEIFGANVSDKDLQILTQAAPLVQERVICLEDAAVMLRFLFQKDTDIVYEDVVLKSLAEDSVKVLDAAISVLEEVACWEAVQLKEALSLALVTGLALKPRVAFGAVRVAVSGSKVSPPLFESLTILGKSSVIFRLLALRDVLLAK